MGLIQAITGAAGGALADSWRDFFYCDADVLDENTLAAKGQKRTSDKGRSSNTKGESNIISDGSIIAVNEGQCMIIVESGEIVDVCAQPGQFVYDRSTEPSVFYGDLGSSIMATFERIGQRFTFGGDTGKDQRIYYFNTKEIYGNKYGTSSPIPFRIVDANLGLDLDTKVRCNGEYSYKLVDPLLFYKNVCGNVEEPYTRDRLESQMKAELLSALQPALARISEMGIRYSAVPAHTKEMCDILNAELSAEWLQRRGIAIVSFAMNSITLPEEVEQKIANLQTSRTLMDPSAGAAYVAAAMGDSMVDAANNPNGAMNAFMGMGMAQGIGGNAVSGMYAQGTAQGVPQSAYGAAANGGFGQPVPGADQAAAQVAEQQAAQPAYQQPFQPQPQPEPAPVAAVAAAPAAAAAGWTCPQCGKVNTSKFCGDCGTPAPAPAEWVCPKCGKTNSSKFCGDCGTPRP